MYIILTISIIPAVLLHFGNQFFAVKSKIGQLPIPGELVPVHI